MTAATNQQPGPRAVVRLLTPGRVLDDDGTPPEDLPPAGPRRLVVVRTPAAAAAALAKARADALAAGFTATSGPGAA
jgi:hypothetical protein